MSSLNQADLRTLNRFRILDEIRLSGPVSRIEIAERTGLSPSLITKITAGLIEEGWISKKPTTPSKSIGRRRVMLELNPAAAYVAGVKISVNQVSFVVVNFRGEVVSSETRAVSLVRHPIEHWNRVISQGVRNCVSMAGLELENITALGVGLPGFVDWQTGHIHWSPLTDGPVPDLGRLLKASFSFKVFLENDVNSITLGEQWFGHGLRVDNFIVVSVEQGLGMGIVVHGQMYRGNRGIGAEFGHVVLRPDGPPCICGKRGCVEAYAGGRGILHTAQKALQEGAWPQLEPKDLSMELLILLGQSGDAAALSIFKTAGEMLGLGVAGLIQVFNPARVIITGEYARLGGMMFDHMSHTMTQNLNRAFLDQDLIIIKEWDDTNWARGAACSVLQNIYRNPVISMGG